MNGLIDFGTLRPNAAMESYQQGQQNQLAQLQMSQAQQAAQDAEAERAAWKGASNYGEVQQRLMGQGLGKQALAVGAAEAKQRADKIALLKDTTNLMKSTATQIMADPTQAEPLLMNFSKQTGHDVTSDLAQLRALGGDLDKTRLWAASHALEADKLLPKFETRDLGGTVERQGYSPVTGKTIGAADVRNKTATPGERMTDVREKERIANAENTNVVAKQVVGEDGTVTNFNKFGQVVSTVKGAGKQSATYAKTEAQKKTMAADQKLVISELKDAVKEGGLIDTSTGSGAGRLYDVGSAFFGKATEGDIAIGRLQPIADLVLKTVPRFEGPQSDADTTSYKEAAGNLANPNLPREKRKAAANEIVRLMEKRQGQFITSDMALGNTATPSVPLPEGYVQD